MANGGMNYWSALGLDIAQNTGAREAQVASSALSGANNSLSNALSATDSFYDYTRNASKDLSNILGTRDENGNWSGWTGLAQILSDKEKQENKEIIDKDLENQFKIEKQQKMQDIATLLSKEKELETENDFLNTTGYTKEGTEKIIEESINAELNKSEYKDILYTDSKVPFTMNYIKKAVLSPTSIRLADLTETQKQFIMDIRKNTKLLKAIQLEDELNQRIIDRENGVYTTDELKQKAINLKASNYSVFNEKTTDEIYKELLAENDLRAGRKAGESLDEFNNRKMTAKTALEQAIFGINLDSRGEQSSNKQQLPSRSSNKSSKVSNKQETTLDIEHTNLSPSNLMGAKGEITLDENGNINDITTMMDDNDEEIFNNPDTGDLISPLDEEDPAVIAEIHSKNLSQLTPKGQELYRKNIQAVSSIQKFKDDKNNVGLFGKLKNKISNELIKLGNDIDLDNLVDRALKGELTYKDEVYIKEALQDPALKNTKEEAIVNVLENMKTLIDTDKALQLGKTSIKEKAYKQNDENINNSVAKINILTNQVNDLKNRIQNTTDERERTALVNEKEELETKIKDLSIEVKGEKFQQAQSIVDGNKDVTSYSNNKKDFEKSNQAKVIGLLINQNEYVFNGEKIEVKIDGDSDDNLNNPLKGILYVTTSRTLDNNRDKEAFLNSILQDKEINDIMAEYTRKSNDLLADKELTEKELFSKISGFNKDISELLNKKIKTYVNLKPASVLYTGKDATTKSLVDSIIKESNNLTVKYLMNQPRTADEAIKFLRED